MRKREAAQQSKFSNVCIERLKRLNTHIGAHETVERRVTEERQPFVSEMIEPRSEFSAAPAQGCSNDTEEAEVD